MPKVYVGESEKALPRTHRLEWRVKNGFRKELIVYIKTSVNPCERA